MKNTPVIPFEVSESLIALGRLLSQARLARGDTLQQAGERIGVHRTTISKIEAGEPACGIGSVFSLLHIYTMTDRLFDLSAPDANTMLLAMKKLPKRGG